MDFNMKNIQGLVFFSLLMVIRQQVHGQDPDMCKADIVFTLDKSGSVRSYGYVNEKSFVKIVAAAFKLDGGRAKAGVVSFADKAKTEITCAEYDNNIDFNAAVDALVPSEEYTNILDGLRHTRNLFQSSCNRPDAQKLAFLLTDGRANIEGYPYEMAKEVRDLGARLFVIGIGALVDLNELNKIAGDSGEVHQCQSFEELVTQQFVDRVLKKVCPPPPVPSTTPRPPNSDCQGAPADVCLVMDMSGSVEDKWDKTKDFAKQLIYAFGINPEGINAGIVTFSLSSFTKMYLDDCMDTDCAIDKINNLGDPEASFTDLDSALIRARDDVLWNSQKGALRVVGSAKATQHLILISDGAASEFYEEDGTNTAADIKAKGGEITVLAIGSDPRLSLLKGIATGPSYFKTAANFNELLEPEFLARFIQEVCGDI